MKKFSRISILFVALCSALLSCTPPETQSTSPVKFTDIPTLDINGKQKQRDLMYKQMNSWAKAQKGNRKLSGTHNPFYQAYLLDKKAFDEDFKTLQSTGTFEACINENYVKAFWGEVGRGAFCVSPDLGRPYAHTVFTSDWNQIYDCDNTGGAPSYAYDDICRYVESDDCQILYRGIKDFVCERGEDCSGEGCSDNDECEAGEDCDDECEAGESCDQESDKDQVMLSLESVEAPFGTAPGDEDGRSESVSPANKDGNYDDIKIDITDVDERGWGIVGTFKNQEFLDVTGSGYRDDMLWNPNSLSMTESGIATLRLTNFSTGRHKKYKVRVDNHPPAIRDISVANTSNADIGLIQGTIIELNQASYQTGIDPEGIEIHFDGVGDLRPDTLQYNADTGHFSVEFGSFIAYKAQQQGLPENPTGFEVIARDHVGNTTSSRQEPDNLKLDIEADLWFSPHADSSKKEAHFQVVDVDNAGAAWTVDIRRGGQVYKTYTGSGTQPLVWDGLFNGEAVPEGKYNIVLKSAKQPGKERVREVAKVGVDMSPPEVYQAKMKSSLQQISFRLKDPLSGVLQNTLEIRMRDSETQAPVQVSYQWLQLGEPDWVMQINSSENFQKVKQNDIFLLVKDHAGNSAEHQLDFNSGITLNSAVIDADGTIVLKGVLLDKSKSFQVLSPVFDNNIELLGAPEVTQVNNRFEMKITDYKYSDSYLEEPVEGEIVDINQGVMISVDACSSGECLSSSQLPLRQERCNVDIPDENVDFMSSCKQENSDFGIQQVKSAPSVRRAFYIHGGKAHNKEIPLILHGKNASKRPISVTYGLGKSLGGGRYLWLKTLSRRQTIAAGGSLQIVAPWDGTGSSGENLASGEYVTLIDSVGYMTNSTKVTVGCEGYYDNYPKIFTPDRLTHSNFRHNPNIWDNDFRQIFIDKLANEQLPGFKSRVFNHRWSDGSKGKLSLFPVNWSKDLIETSAISLANNFTSSDDCSVQSDGNYRLHGVRNNLYLRTIVYPSGKINTSFPPNGPKAFQYYQQTEGQNVLEIQ